jgi:hypothetical protein
MTRKDVTPTADGSVDAFLEEVRRLPVAAAEAGRRGRLIFAMDATASREPTWDTAAQLQAEMFLEADRLGGLDVQLVYYRGFDECRASRWVRDAKALVRLMTSVTCRAGQTQIRRVLRHALKEARQSRVHALVFIGDCCEEDADELGQLAGELGLLGTRAFVFQEGRDPTASRVFRDLAKLTGGAHCCFDRAAADQLRELLRAVAAFAAGGRAALAALERHGSPTVRLLAGQVR